MTGSSKQLKNKTVGGDTEFTNIFETWMDEVAAASDGSGAGSAGVAEYSLQLTLLSNTFKVPKVKSGLSSSRKDLWGLASTTTFRWFTSEAPKWM